MVIPMYLRPNSRVKLNDSESSPLIVGMVLETLFPWLTSLLQYACPSLSGSSISYTFTFWIMFFWSSLSTEVESSIAEKWKFL